MAKEKTPNLIHEAVITLLTTIDRFLTGGGLEIHELPPSNLRKAVDNLLNGKQSASVLTGCLFLTFYKVVNPSYTFDVIPVGSRGAVGDKLLGAELKHRYITLGQVTAWGENVGFKGNQSNFRLDTDSRFSSYIGIISQAENQDIEKAALYMASLFAASQALPALLPALSADTLTFARAKLLFKSLAYAEAGGSIQQFLVAALLKILRAKQNIRVETHNFNAADTYDGTAGDIEEFVDDKLLRAYEVTARPDWKNRLPDFRDKMDRAGLHKYIIIATNVNIDNELREPTAMALRIEAIQRDIAVVDIMDFFTWMAAELSPLELQQALQDVRDMLVNPKLGGKQAHTITYSTIVGDWLDSVAEAAAKSK